jgi:hypothetical protein
MSLENENTTTMSWVFFIIVFFIFASIAVGILCCCSGKFAVDASALPHVIRDIERSAAAS